MNKNRCIFQSIFKSIRAIIGLFIILYIVNVTLFAQTLSSNATQNLLKERSNTALSEMRMGNMKRAEELWSELIRIKQLLSAQENAFALEQRAICRMQLGIDSLALTDISRSLELSPKADAYYTRAHILLRQKLFPSALTDIEKALEQIPDRADYYVLRANIYVALGEKQLGCNDLSMARILGFSLTDDIMKNTCAMLGYRINAGDIHTKTDSLQKETETKTTQSVADASIQSLLLTTDYLNTKYFRFSIQAHYGRSAPFLSRLYYDTQAGIGVMVNIGYSLSREYTLWIGGEWTSLPYTYGSERSQIPEDTPPPFGEVVSYAVMAGGRYSQVISNTVDFQVDLGLGYRRRFYPTSALIPFRDGSVRKANLGIAEASGLAVHSAFGLEWRVLKNIAITGGAQFGISFVPYNFLTINRRDREDSHQFLGFTGGLRFYFLEQQ